MAKKFEAIFAGTGGRGVLTAGQILTQEGLNHYPFVLYFPSYGTEMRGGSSECTVVLSEKPIGSMVLTQADVLVMFDISQMETFAPRIKPGGLLVLESSTLENGAKPESVPAGVNVVNVPALKIAGELGDMRTINLILLGAYVKATGALAPEAIEERLKKRFEEKGLTKVLPLNIEAFRKGLAAAQ